MEHCGDRLVIEAKQYDGVGDLPGWPSDGQMRFLRDEAALGKTVLVLWGCGVCNDPYAVLDVRRDGQQLYDWRGRSKNDRRAQLKLHIGRAMGLLDEEFHPRAREQRP